MVIMYTSHLAFGQQVIHRKGKRNQNWEVLRNGVVGEVEKKEEEEEEEQSVGRHLLVEVTER